MKNYFSIIKSITIIFMYASCLKKKKKIPSIFLCFYTHKLYYSETTIFFFSLSTIVPTFFFSLCGTPFFFLFVFYFLAHHTHAFLHLKACPHTHQLGRSRYLGTPRTVLCKELELLAIQAYHKLIKE